MLMANLLTFEQQGERALLNVVCYESARNMTVWAVTPAPMMTQEEREALHDKALQGIVLHGYWVEWAKLVRNPVFDKGNEKSTLQIKCRPCQNVIEAEETICRVMALLDNKGE